ncbi:MAG: right-handed parallel beta-helix repeat-containing protein [Planctomycetes bacterium]|nr:right-handed parallel beta-helix repeat-containing protein [Planctomycetota bacterium]
MEPIDRRMMLSAAGLLGAAALAKVAEAGPINPPAGPIIGTGKTLNEVEPRTALDPDAFFSNIVISAPGSYYLTKSFEGQIRITSTNVTLDLNGFTVTSNSTISNQAAILVTIGQKNVLIRNGRVVMRSVASAGIDCQMLQAGCVIEDMQIVSELSGVQTVYGIRCDGPLVVRRVTLQGAFGIGIGGVGGDFSDCVVLATAASAYGITTLGVAGTISRCTVLDVGQGPCLDAGPGSLVTDCLVRGGRPGIALGGRCRVVRCAVFNAAGAGVSAGSKSTLSDCVIQGTTSIDLNASGRGVLAIDRLRLERCQIANTDGGGVRATSFDLTAIDCTITENNGWGIDCIGPAQIERSHFANNTSGGITTDQLTRVGQCHLDFNGPFGVRATATSGGGVDVVDCTITRNDVGVSLAGTSGSMVRRCTFYSNNSHISSAAGNFALVAVGAASANAATNPNVNLAL